MLEVSVKVLFAPYRQPYSSAVLTTTFSSFARVLIYIHTYTYFCIHTHTHICTCCMCVCVCVCVYRVTIEVGHTFDDKCLTFSFFFSHRTQNQNE